MSEDRRGRALARAKDARTDNNLYFHATYPELSDAMLIKQRKDGVDLHSVAADPLFKDPANGDFRLSPDSPARKLGFVPIDLSKVGLVEENEARQLDQK